MKKEKAQKDILYISISSFVLVALWIGFNLYHAHVTSTITPDLQLKIVPIDPKFNTDVIQKLKTRQQITPLYESLSSSSSATTTPEPTAGTGTSASGSGQPVIPANSIERLGQ
ncbi:MAG TPA: hypothetical protein VLG67_04110 [Candidatus Saccharimonadales bacterium]|nr:hypothetical protein [Candidatus Saccharimonadales bacterium]